jgi:hypothetical protein
LTPATIVTPTVTPIILTRPIWIVRADGFDPNYSSEPVEGTSPRALDIPRTSNINWLYIDDISGSTPAWISSQADAAILWNIHQNKFSSEHHSNLFSQFFPKQTFHIGPIAGLQQCDELFSNLHLLDAMYTPGPTGSVVSWIQKITRLLLVAITMSPAFHQASLWIPKSYLPHDIRIYCHHILSDILQNGSWLISLRLYKSTEFGECIQADRYVFEIYSTDPNHHNIDSRHPVHVTSTSSIAVDTDFGKHLQTTSSTQPNGGDILELPLQPTNTPSTEHSHLIPRVLAIIENSNHHQSRNTITSSNLILDPAFPAKEPCRKEASNTLFGRRFGVAFQQGTKWFARSLLTSELLKMYSINAPPLHLTPPHFDISDVADDLRPFSLPWKFCAEFLNNLPTPLWTHSYSATVFAVMHPSATLPPPLQLLLIGKQPTWPTPTLQPSLLICPNQVHHHLGRLQN